MARGPAKFVWYDAMTSDLEAAKQFYRSVIGWNMADSGMANHYTILSVGSTMVGGLMPTPDEARAHGAQPMWFGYIGVDDVDAYAERVAAAKGSVHRRPEDIPGVGRFAVVADPHGAEFILFKGNGSEEPAEVPEGTPGYVGWRELRAGDGEAAFAFYSELFGWTKEEGLDMGSMGIYQTFSTGGPPVGGVMTKTKEADRPHWLYYINVDGVDAAVSRVKQAGGTVLFGPHEVPGGSWVAICHDPQGAGFGVLSPKR